VAGSKAHVILNPLQKFINKYGRFLIALVFGVLGLYLLAKGVHSILYP
jgi:cadmium resistance protein CadD (predicted permease)